MRFVVSPSTSSNFAPAVEKGRAAVLLCFFTVSHLVSSDNRQAQRLCGGLRLRSISKAGAGWAAALRSPHSALSSQHSAKDPLMICHPERSEVARRSGRSNGVEGPLFCR